MKQLSICLHSKTLSHRSIVAGSNIASNTKRYWVQGRVDLNSLLGGLPSSGHRANDQNRLVAFATVSKLEKFCEAETIYIDGTFKASPQLFYHFLTVHAMYNGQHIHCTVNRIPMSSSYRQHHISTIQFPLHQFPLCQFPLRQHWPNGNWQSGNWQRGNWKSGKLSKWELTT